MGAQSSPPGAQAYARTPRFRVVSVVLFAFFPNKPFRLPPARSLSERRLAIKLENFLRGFAALQQIEHLRYPLG